MCLTVDTSLVFTDETTPHIYVSNSIQVLPSIYPIELSKIFDPKYGSPTSKLLLYVCCSKTWKTHKMQIFKAAFLVFFSKVIASCFFLWCICLNFGAIIIGKPNFKKRLSILVFQGCRHVSKIGSLGDTTTKRLWFV